VYNFVVSDAKMASSSGSRISLIALTLFLCAAGARADIYNVTFTDVTFTVTCIGGTGLCTDVINGSGLYDSVANTASSLSVQLTGADTATLDGFSPAPHCTSPQCLTPDYLYDLGAILGDDPIEFGPDLSTLKSPTPTNLASDTELYIPVTCGGDQANCGATGDFPAGDFAITSGKYTSVDVGPSPVPEPASYAFVLCGLGALVALRHRRKVFR
jgi:hypothetical protein